MERLGWESNVLRQTTEGVSDCAVGEAGTTSRYVERHLEALQLHNVRLAMSVTKSFGGWGGRELSGLKRSSVNDIRE